jgi:hypothetical protein
MPSRFKSSVLRGGVYGVGEVEVKVGHPKLFCVLLMKMAV